MKQTRTYKLGIFESGDFLIPTFDRRRFVTLDYHLNTYVGILGNGIISGWNVESVGGLIVRMTPGTGFIAGLYAESPYAIDQSTKEPLRKSVATNLGYTITEEIISWTGKSGTWTGSFFKEGGSPDTDALVFQQLGPDGEDKNYDGIIDGILAPKYVPAPTSHLTNPYVKSYAPIDNQLLLENNSDTYIFAERISEDPTSTFVRFVATTAYALTSRRVLVAKVVTRGGEIYQVDESMSFRISGMTGKIADLGRELVKTHTHGGNALTDPPRINLKTDIRKCIPSNKVNDVVSYSILPSKRTGTTANHRHEFDADASGNGYTTSVLGDYEFHFHKIKNWQIVKTQLNYESTTAVDHTHTFPKEDSVLSQDGLFKVYVNGIELDPNDYVVNAKTKTISFAIGKVNFTYPVYRSSFEIGGTTADGPKRVYKYELETPSIKNFMTGMMIDFYRQYRTEIEGYGVTEILKTVTVGSEEYGTGAEEDVEITQLETTADYYYLRSPFQMEYTEDGRNVERDEKGRYYVQDYIPISKPITGNRLGNKKDSTLTTPLKQIQSNIKEKSSINTRGFEDVDPMSKMASTVLKKQGDQFVILPNVAKFVTMEMVSPGHADDVIIEILDNVEVTGLLKSGNIYFVSADKFMSGEFNPARIPFLNHVGRIGEIFAPQMFSTTSKNGMEFIPTTRMTRTSMGHAHRIYSDEQGNGVTLATTVGDQLSVYQYDKDGKAIKITHAHSVSGNNTSSAVNDGVNTWNEIPAGTSHSHEIDEISYGTHKSVYSMSMDDNGNLLFIASDGAWVLPSGRAILTTIGTKQYYSYGKTVQETLVISISRYANDTGEEITVDETLTSQSSTAELALLSVSDTYSFGGIPPISMSVVEYAKVDNLYEETTKEKAEIGADEIVVRALKNDEETVASLIGVALGTAQSEPTRFLVRHDFSNRIIWTSCCDSFQFSIAAYDGIIQGTPDDRWKEISLPMSYGMIRAVAIASPSESSSSSSGENSSIILAASMGGLMISRSGGLSYSMLSAMAGENCMDVVATSSAFVASTNSGIYLVNYDGSCSQTMTSANLRWLAVDKYDNSIYCLDLDGTIFQSTDEGTTWSTFSTLPADIGATGRLFACFGQIFVATNSGLLNVYSNQVVLDWTVRCSMWSNDRVMYFGGDGYVVSTVDGVNFDTVMSFEGSTFPAFYVDNEQRLFGYAHNQNKGVVFLIPPDADEVVTASTVAERWIAPEGSWDSNANVDFVIDGKYVFSNRLNIDERGKTCDNFVIDPISGSLDFSTFRTLATNALAGDEVLYLSDSVGSASNRGVVISDALGKLYLYADSISGNVIRLSSPLTRSVSIDSRIRILSSMTVQSLVSGNLYYSDLDQVGTMSHQNIEDGLSQATVGLPMRISETYLGNLSVLAMASKRAFNDVDSKLKNWKAFGMEYDCDPESENYYGNDFDIDATIAGSHSFFGKDSGNSISQYIRCITFGDGDFDGKVFAGTDAGLFVSETAYGMENPWIPILECPVSDVFGIVIVGGTSIIVAGEGGIYKSDNRDLTKWTKTANFSRVASRATSLSLRWSGSQGTYWWNSWDGSVNTMSSDLTNAIVAGGSNFLMVSHDDGSSWVSISLDIAGNDYEPSCFLPMSDGTAVMATNGGSSGKTSIIYDLGAGDSWGEAATFPGIEARVTGCTQNEAGNVALQLTYSGSVPNLKDHSLTGLVAIIGTAKRTIADNRDGIILLQGTDMVDTGTWLSISPVTVNSLAETIDGKIIVGTNLGLLTDNGTYLTTSNSKAIVNSANKSATVEYIDLGGTVISSDIKPNGKVSLVCQLEQSVRANDLEGRKLIFTSTTNPSISILSPVTGSTVASSEVSVVTSTTMFEPGKTGFIKIKIDAREPVYASSNTTKISGIPSGSHVLEVALVGMDKIAYSGVGTSRRINFYTTTAANTPAISVSSPTSGQTIGFPSLDVTGQVLNFVAGVDGNLTYSVDNGTAEAVIVRQDGWFSIPISNLSNAAHSVRLSLVGFVSGQTITYIDVPFSVRLTSDPYIRISTPTNNSTVLTNYVEIKYSIANFSVPNDGLVSASLDGGTPVTSKSSSSVALTNLPDGKHTVALTLVDNTLVPIRTAYGSANLSITVAATNARQPLIVALAPNDGSVFAIGTTYVDISYDVTNYTIPDDGGVVIKVGDSETFVKSLLPYKLPVTPGKYAVTLTLATSASAKLTNKEATTKIEFTVGTESERSTRNVNVLSPSVPEISSKAIAEPKEAVNVLSPSVPEISSKAIAEPKEAEDSSSSGEKASKGFVIVSNGSSALNGQTTIVLSLTTDESINGLTFRIVDKTSTIYFSPNYPIKSGEFDGGKMYIDTAERVNGGMSYDIVSNTASYAVLSSAIQPPSSDSVLNSVAVGQKVRFANKQGFDELWVTFDRDWERNSLAGEMVSVDHAEGGRSYGVVLSNTSRTMQVYGLDREQMLPGDSMLIVTPVFSDVKTFTATNTSINLDHSHTTSLISNWIKGGISGISLISSSKVLVTALDSSGLDDPLIVSNSQVAKGTKIMFYSQDGELAFEETIDLVYPTGVVVDVSEASHWNIDGSKSFGIDSTYKWESDTRHCGVTSSTVYSDFIAYTTALDRDVDIGTTNVWVSDISKFSVGDTVELFDSSGTIQRTTINSISDHLIVDDPAEKTFSMESRASVRARRSSYPIDHIHEIKNGEVNPVDVEEYQSNGYSLSHNHVLSSLINSVTCVKKDASGAIYVGGTSEKILTTTDDGETWNVATNLDNYGEPCSIASCMSLGTDGTLTIGTGCGFVVQQATTVDKNAIPISIHEIEASSSSSSESSSSIKSSQTSNSSYSSSNSSDSSSSSESF